MTRLTDEQRKLSDEGHALVVRCDACLSEHFLARLPIPVDEMVKITRRFKCPTDRAHKLLMGPLRSPEETKSE